MEEMGAGWGAVQGTRCSQGRTGRGQGAGWEEDRGVIFSGAGGWRWECRSSSGFAHCLLNVDRNTS